MNINFFRFAAALALGWLPCVAQSTAGRISGSVQDSTGALIPGAEVTVQSIATSQRLSMTTNTSGQFVFYPLQAEMYRLTATMAGFRELSIDGIRLEVGDNLIQNLTLEIGTSQQEVTISAASVPIISQSPSVEGTISEQQTAALPLNGRSFDDLVLLTAGAVDNRLAGGGNDPGPYSVNGNRSYGNNFLVDGVSNNNVFQPQAAAAISIDAIREFKVISGVPPAEYGQAAAAVSVVTRSGTNRYHGNVYEYFRGTVMQARDPFNTVGTQPYAEHKAGGSFGGPVRLPRYNGKNRTFFFTNYEAGRLKSNATRVVSVPPAEFWKGDFSALLSRNIQLRDPLITGRPPIPGNRLDTYMGGGRINATALKFQPLFGSPDRAGYVNNAARFPEETNNSDQVTARIDHLLPKNHSISGRLIYSDANLHQPWGLGTPGPFSTQYSGSRNLMLTWTAPVGTRAVNEFKFGWSKVTVNGAYENNGTPTVDSLGLRGFLNADSATIPYLPQFNFQGNDTFTTTNYGPNAGYGNGIRNFTEKLTTISETFSWSPGRHQFKMGFQGFRSNFDALNILQMRGQVNFNSASANSSGYSFSDFLMGLPATSSQPTGRPSEVLIQPQYGFFLQDDWRLGRRLTLSLGVREEIYRSPVEEKDRISLFSPEIAGMVVACSGGKLPSAEFPAKVVSAFAPNGTWPFPLVCAGDGNGYSPRGLTPDHNNNWAPRIGFAWEPFASGRLSVRGGYGVTYTRYPLLNYITANSNNPPFSGSFAFAQRITDGVPLITLNAPFSAAATNSVSATGISKDFGLPVNHQWNLTLERAVGQSTVLSLAYIGNRGVKLFRQIDVNGTRVDPTTGKVVRAFAERFGTLAIPFRVSDGTSIFHSMKLEARRRFTRGFGIQANWTWGKGIDDVGQQLQTTLIDVENLGRDRAVSDYSRDHIVAANGTWDFPIGRKRKFASSMPVWLETIAGGWTASGILQWTTGRHGTPSTVSSNGLSNTRPDVVGNPNLPSGQRTPERWFDTSAFTPATTDPATGLPRFGNAGRNTIIFPGLNMVNGNLAKSIRLGGEQRRLVLRLEVFNVLNHPNWNNPSANVSANNAGRISSLARPMRQAQFAVRYEF